MERTDTERLDWVIDAMMTNPEGGKALVLAGALMMGLKGREAIDAAMDDKVPRGVIGAAALIVNAD